MQSNGIKRVLVTGANGQLGREMRRLGAASPNEYTFTDIEELDITDAAAVMQCVRGGGYDVILNCAAYTNVDRAEDDEAAAERINCDAVRNLAEAAERTGAVLFHISTDYVFGGYGRTKLHGEQAVAVSGCRAVIVRTAWLYSEYGNNFLKTMLRLTAERPELNVVFDQVGSPTYAGDLAIALFTIIEGGLYDGNEGVYHFSNEGVCSWYDFAVEIARAAGHDGCAIHPCHSDEFPSKVKRPAYSVLDKSKIRQTFGLDIPHWRESMEYCIERIKKSGQQ